MKTKRNLIQNWLLCAVLSTLTPFFVAQPSTAFAQGTAFTYQGRLQNNGSPASGTYNLTFSLFNTNTSGVPIAGPVTNNTVGVTNGLFTVLIDFGPGAFTGQSNWLEIAVETNGVNSFTTLAPRQQLTPAPYAVYAESASGLSGTLSADQLTSIGNDNGGSCNFFIGSSGNSTMSGDDNTANGYAALHSNTDGSGNTANGFDALFSNTEGNDNTADGHGALLNNTSGSQNTANGAQALYLNTSGSDNTAIGADALAYNTSGSYNTANGPWALFWNTSGSNNIALGFQAGLNITTGSSNIDLGNQGSDTDNNIIRIGSGQTDAYIAGVIHGNGGGLTNLNTSQLTSIGNTNSIFGGNFFIGPSGNSTTRGSYNTANGANALFSNTSGSYNTADGNGALYNNTSGFENTANGVAALYSNTSGSENTANGLNALESNTTGGFNTANGLNALFSNTNGFANTANGIAALESNTSGSVNTAVGDEALFSNTSGSYNTALGYQAGGNITTGSYNIDIGNTGSTTDTNIIRIGTSQTATYLVGTVYANGVALTSDRNAKENFTAVNAREVLAKVASLPVTEWNYRTDSKDVQHIGPMAQDFQATFGLAGQDDKHISVLDEGGVALAAIQGLNQKLEEQAKEKDAEIQDLKQSVANLKKLLQSLAERK